MENKELGRILLSVCICAFVGVLVGYITSTYISEWYDLLKKPFFTPPNWLSAPIWTILYIIMGYAFGLIWNLKYKNKQGVKKAMVLFGIQLLLNFIWPFLFFICHNPLLSMLDVILLWCMLVLTIKAFKVTDGFAGRILYPYLAWISFAIVFNGSILYLNR
jgi:translocator protein